MTELQDRIIRALRTTDEPARSAKQLSNELDVSVKSINNNITDLVEENRVETVEIGNATAYYISIQDFPAHEKPDHFCSKCGREVNDSQDSGRVEFESYFSDQRTSDDVVTRQVLCRFCYHDFVSWLHNDESLMHVYPHVEEWDVPDHQIQEVKNDPDIRTSYPAEGE
jgi:Fe2+ or Zn2+ uptake regulation protein